MREKLFRRFRYHWPSPFTLWSRNYTAIHPCQEDFLGRSMTIKVCDRHTNIAKNTLFCWWYVFYEMCRICRRPLLPYVNRSTFHEDVLENDFYIFLFIDLDLWPFDLKNTSSFTYAISKLYTIWTFYSVPILNKWRYVIHLVRQISQK